MSPLLWCEMFTGTASVTLQLLGGAATPIGYMGNKRRWSRLILDIMGMHERPDVIVLCDAGPWGEAWEVILDVERRPLLVERLRSWSGEDPSALWQRLAEAGRPEDVVERVASWLWLQGRAANNSPVWWEDGASLSMCHKNMVGAACEQHAVLVQPGGSSAGKIMSACCATTGSAVVSEAVPLPLDGWHTVRLTEPHARHAEWLTMSTAPAMAWPAQLTLWAPS